MPALVPLGLSENLNHLAHCRHDLKPLGINLRKTTQVFFVLITQSVSGQPVLLLEDLLTNLAQFSCEAWLSTS